MLRIPSYWLIAIISCMLAVLAGVAISGQDKYTVQVPNGLAFSEFRGYEDWPVIAISENGGKIAVIVGNPVMIDAYKEGVPAGAIADPTLHACDRAAVEQASRALAAAQAELAAAEERWLELEILREEIEGSA